MRGASCVPPRTASQNPYRCATALSKKSPRMAGAGDQMRLSGETACLPGQVVPSAGWAPPTTPDRNCRTGCMQIRHFGGRTPCRRGRCPVCRRPAPPVLESIHPRVAAKRVRDRSEVSARVRRTACGMPVHAVTPPQDDRAALPDGFGEDWAQLDASEAKRHVIPLPGQRGLPSTSRWRRAAPDRAGPRLGCRPVAAALRAQR